MNNMYIKISTVWLEMEWFDERLKWTPNDYNSTTEITLPVNKIWVPDIVIQVRNCCSLFLHIIY